MALFSVPLCAYWLWKQWKWAIIYLAMDGVPHFIRNSYGCFSWQLCRISQYNGIFKMYFGQFKMLFSKGHSSCLHVTEYHTHIDCVFVNRWDNCLLGTHIFSYIASVVFHWWVHTNPHVVSHTHFIGANELLLASWYVRPTFSAIFVYNYILSSTSE